MKQVIDDWKRYCDSGLMSFLMIGVATYQLGSLLIYVLIVNHFGTLVIKEQT